MLDRIPAPPNIPGSPVNRYRFVHVDVFTRQRFGGNQLAVFTDARGLDAATMQAIATEMNFAESTFVFPPQDAANDANVRIFTPATELPFAGHPVVGTTFVLGHERKKQQLRLEVKVGTLSVTADAGDGMFGEATMEQPLPTFRPSEASRERLAALLGLTTSDLHSTLRAEFGSAGVEFLFLPLASLDAVRRATPDAAAWPGVFGSSAHPAVYLFSTETIESGSNAHGRMLSKLIANSIAEDPATGSAAGPLGAYLVRNGVTECGEATLEQGYEMGRPSQITVTVATSGESIASVHVGGGVVHVAEGQLVA
jgi:trans-2,3-dihydro-3-hydroxyanthranilate isomerase